jgi:hypothetical protein
MAVCQQLLTITSIRPLPGTTYERRRMMPPADSTPSKRANIASTSLPAVADGVIQVGAQFRDGNETSTPDSVAKASGSTVNVPKLKDISSSPKLLRRYLQTAQRTEILSIGKQSSRASRAFDNHLLVTIDGVLMQIEASDIKEVLSLNP